MNKEEFKKANKVVRNSLEEVTKLVYKLLEEQDDKHKMFVMEGALHAVIHTLEHEAPSGLYSTQFIVGALNDVLLANIQRDVEEDNEIEASSPDDSEMIH
tara:strand:+ start:1109 stop:1408 length:300 start_codon:yes stop_codon:yes gene_type:complete